MDFLKEILSGPLYSVVTFANEQFNGPLLEFAHPGFGSGDIFILVIEGSLEMTSFPLNKAEEAHSGKRLLKTGDVFYLPLQFGHRANLAPDSTHAITLSIVNMAPGIFREFEPQLLSVSSSSLIRTI